MLAGSTAFEPIAKIAADAYRDHYHCTGAHFAYDANDSASGITMLTQAEAQNPAKADAMMAMYDGTDASPTQFIAHPVGVLVYAIVANSTYSHESWISVNGLKRIFLPPGKPGMLAVGRLAGSGSRKALLHGVFQLPNWGSVPVSAKSCPPPSGYTACTEDYTQQVLAYVNAIPNAIGYAGYTLFIKSQAIYPNVYVVNIGNAAPGVKPGVNTVKNRTYGFWVVEHLYMTTQPTALARSFLAFLPNYLASDQQDGFLACPAVPKNLGTDC